MSTEPTPPTPPAAENTAAPAPAPTPAPAPVAAPKPPPATGYRGPGVPAGPGSNNRGGPPKPGGPRPGGASRGFPAGDKPPRDKPLNVGGMPANLSEGGFKGFKPNNRELDKMIEDELNQAISGFSELEASAAHTGQRSTGARTPGQRKSGRVVSIHGQDVFVEVPGGRGQGLLPLEQFDGAAPKVGDVVEFDIDRYDAANGLLLLTREGSVQSVTDWSSVSLHMIVEAKVTGTNKNKTGLTIEVNGIKGFLPASQLDMYRVEDIDQFINQRLRVQVVELDPEERNLIVSRRAIMERERQQKAEQFWATIQEGAVLKGIVKSIKAFGAFVDLGGADGLIPISEFSWQRVNDLNEVVKIGQQVEVKVTRVDRDARKIGLSVKELITSPFTEFADRVKAGARLQGKVTRVAEFGAFVELEPGVEGLVHVSELSTQRVRRVRDVVEEGQVVQVEVLSVDPETRRIALSLKSISQEKEDAETAAETAEREADEKAAAEKMASRPVNPNLRGGIGAAPFKYDAP
ncbi:30S ribosomal protein S1 [Gemmata sp.]|uniref:30S ribosomal protein S1 n=1 Tax=Gemmata sp. TaxID=1914242 RepID=UPI003F70C7A7